MNAAIAAGVVLVLCFGFVLYFGAPYLPTLHKARGDALALLDLRPGQLLIELGCGDGAVLLAASRQGLQAVGYELNPVLVVIARLRTWRYRRNVRVVWGTFWRADLQPADGVYVFLLECFMPRLESFLRHTPHKKRLKVVSYAFQLPGQKPAKRRGAMYLYVFD